MDANRNQIVTNAWSNPAARELYNAKWPTEPVCQALYEAGRQCGGCSFFAPFNSDWGLCTQKASPHYLETVYEHFTCREHVNEGWGPHSFTANPTFQCRCGGEPSEYWDNLIDILQKYEKPHDA